MRVLLATLLITTIGCGAGIDAGRAPSAKEDLTVLDTSKSIDTAEDKPFQTFGRAPDEPESGEPLPAEGEVTRKIIYTADVELVVEDFSGVPAEVEALANKFDGYVKNSSMTGTTGAQRSGRWTIRVPVDRYEPFLDAVLALGELRRRSSDAQDVTEEYYDVQARMRNKEKQEERLLEHLEMSTGTLEDILAVEQHLARVREEIDRLKGRMRVLEELTSMTTVELHVQEIRDYVPEAAAGFGTRAQRAFADSYDSLRTAGENTALFFVRVSLWLPIILVGVAILYVVLRRLLGRRAAHP